MKENRSRPVSMEFSLTKQEHEWLKEMAHRLRGGNLSALCRKLAIDQRIFDIDYKTIDDVHLESVRVLTNLQQIYDVLPVSEKRLGGQKLRLVMNEIDALRTQVTRAMYGNQKIRKLM